MSNPQKIILVIFYIVMAIRIISTYPSMGSLILLFAVMLSLVSLLWQRFVNNRDNGGFDDDV